jgi:hypothetical protein
VEDIARELKDIVLLRTSVEKHCSHVRGFEESLVLTSPKKFATN